MSFFSAIFAAVSLLLGSLFATLPATAQVTIDGTTSTTVNAEGNNFTIEQGDRAGGNLFHSFSDFSVPTGGQASFNNAADVENILSRVTGGNISNIDGLVRANGGANLFLVNPSGIIFGSGASLEIGGSFYGSSADSVLFEDGEFSATDLSNPPLLTVNAPIGLGFRDQPGDITNNSVANNGRGLEVNPGNNISLLGGDVNFDGGRIFAPGGDVNLGGLTGAQTISFADDGSLSFSDNALKANVSLTDNAVVDITLDGGGLIAVNANNLELTQESLFIADIGKGLSSEDAVAGTIDIDATRIFADGNSLIHSDNLGTGQAGTINIDTNALNLTNGAAITATTFGVGDAGTINITAQNIVLDQEFTGIYSNVGLTNIASESLELNVEGVKGNGGVINIDTDNLSLTKGARIISSSIAQGNGGTVNINATGAVSYIGQGNTSVPSFGGGSVISGSFSQVQQNGVGNSGEVNITADSLTLQDKGAVLTDNSGVGGNAGDITLDIQNNIFLDQGALILAQVQPEATGNGGDINIAASSLDAKGISQISADTKGIGDAGNIKLDIEETLSLDETSFILTEVGQNAVGNAGDITITANTLIVKNDADIASQTKGQGDAGKITITTNDDILLENRGEIRSLVEPGATGNGGKIDIITNKLDIFDGASISVRSLGQGNSGNVLIQANSLDLNEDSAIGAETAFGTGGNIQLQVTDGVVLENNSSISAEANINANGGNLTIDSNFIVAFPNQNNDIIANATQGQGGNIDITAKSVFGIEERPLSDFTNDINASSESNLDGTVSLSILETNALQGTTDLPTNVIQPQQTTEQACAASRETSKPNGLTVNGKGGIPPAPELPLNSQTLVANGQENSSTTTETNQAQAQLNKLTSSNHTHHTSQGDITPAEGVVATKDGRVILTAYPTDANSRVAQGSANCAVKTQEAKSKN